ncbi:hypothetical protein HYALB_00009885 [Hymenoscyphus albidus]|uniref:Uncharacterized protein n=1 Tax=Hymenoscyphus albidus TaxID=595503 RepID=A0A9N9Q869_9HELO|nr:hypothetical protein HYALB_00009885 [Hymenoscyphus albidus]
MITWSAFPRTTSHSILPVTCGHLITLTYNLYVTEAVGGILQRYPIADPRLYPLFKMIKGLLGDSHFMPDGGTLGQHCIHTYSHTRRQTQHHMPYSLLGTDAILFSVFHALGLKTMVAPVLGDEAWDEWTQIREEKLFRKIYEDGEMEERARAKREESDDEMVDEEDEGEGDSEDDGEGESEDEFEDGEETARVGKGWWRLKMVAEGGECEDGIFRTGKDPTSYINKHYPLHAISPITWLNESTPNGWEIAMVNLKSSSQATPKPTPTTKAKEVEGAGKETRELMWQYSHAAIFVEIPPFGKGVRGGK